MHCQDVEDYNDKLTYLSEDNSYGIQSVLGVR